MNKTTNPISNTETRAVLVVAVFAAIFFASFFADDAVRRYQDSLAPRSAINFAVDDVVPKTPAGLHLITAFIFLSLIRPRRFFVATILSATYACLFLLSLYLRVDGESFFGGPIPGDPGFLGELYLKTWIWDYVAFAYLIVLFPWLFSILFRIHKQNSLDGQLP
jgi:hypothetical protein